MKSLLFVLLAAPVFANAAECTINWSHDGQNVDGTPATLAGFNLYGGDQVVEIDDPAQRSITVDCTPGDVYYMTAYDTAGDVSDRSNTVSANPPSAPTITIRVVVDVEVQQ